MPQILPHLRTLARRGWIVPFAGSTAAALAIVEGGLGPVVHMSDGNPYTVAVIRAARRDPAAFAARVDALARPIEALDRAGQREAFGVLRAAVNATPADVLDPEIYAVVWGLTLNGILRWSRRGFNGQPRALAGGAPVRSILDRDALVAWGRALAAHLPNPWVEDWSAAPRPSLDFPAYYDPPYVGSYSYDRTPYDHSAWHAYLGALPGGWAQSNAAAAADRYPEIYPGAAQILRSGTVSSDGAGRAPVYELLALRPWGRIGG